MSTTRQLIKELIETDFEDIPSAAVEKIRGAILDDVGIAFQGYAMQGQTLVDYARDAGGRARVHHCWRWSEGVRGRGGRV